jgi:hypothetical protein
VVLRQSLIELSNSRFVQQGQETKMGQVYKYLTGMKFRQRVEAVIEKFEEMRNDLDRERKFMGKQWSKREAQILAVVDSTVGMVGDLQSIAGKAMPEIPSPDMPLLASTDREANVMISKRRDGIHPLRDIPVSPRDLGCCTTCKHNAQRHARLGFESYRAKKRGIGMVLKIVEEAKEAYHGCPWLSLIPALLGKRLSRFFGFAPSLRFLCKGACGGIRRNMRFVMAQQFTSRSAFASRGRRWLHEQGGLGIGKHCGLIAKRTRR